MLYIEAHKDLPYSVVLTAMAACKEAGVKLHLLAEKTDSIDYAAMDAEISK
jgi:hypothetical protein